MTKAPWFVIHVDRAMDHDVELKLTYVGFLYVTMTSSPRRCVNKKFMSKQSLLAISEASWLWMCGPFQNLHYPMFVPRLLSKEYSLRICLYHFFQWRSIMTFWLYSFLAKVMLGLWILWLSWKFTLNDIVILTVIWAWCQFLEAPFHLLKISRIRFFFGRIVMTVIGR